MAVGYVVLMGIVLVFVGMTINLGQMAQVRTAVSNSADAGALAGASWVASGENEATMIAQKMWDSIDMVQAIYLVPFCPAHDGYNPALYANQLWQALSINNVFFFGPIANDIMDAAWNIGRRETFTATVNNMLARFPCAADTQGWGSTGDEIIHHIDSYQHLLETPNDGELNTSFSWTNCLPSGNPALLRHVMRFHATYPGTPPTLQFVTEGTAAAYFQYAPNVTGPNIHFDCSFNGRGIDGGPLPTPLVMDSGVSYGGMDSAGRKNWDIPLAHIYPPFGTNLFTDIVLQTCASGICGMAGGETQPYVVAPRRIVPPNGNVQVQAFHRVTREAGGLDPLFHLPMWGQAFPEVGASAQADYTGPQDADLGQNAAIRRTASARLTAAH